MKIYQVVDHLFGLRPSINQIAKKYDLRFSGFEALGMIDYLSNQRLQEIISAMNIADRINPPA